MSQVSLRPATPADLPGAARLWEALNAFHRGVGLGFPESEGAAQAWLASFERTLGRFSFLWVAESGGQIAGFLLARLKRVPAYLGGVMVGEISDLYVSDSLRGQGVGARLAALALEQFEQLAVHSVEVQIMSANAGGLAFWKAQGFSEELVQVRRVLNADEARRA